MLITFTTPVSWKTHWVKSCAKPAFPVSILSRIVSLSLHRSQAYSRFAVRGLDGLSPPFITEHGTAANKANSNIVPSLQRADEIGVFPAHDTLLGSLGEGVFDRRLIRTEGFLGADISSFGAM